jgi:hypothetical protein
MRASNQFNPKEVLLMGELVDRLLTRKDARDLTEDPSFAGVARKWYAMKQRINHLRDQEELSPEDRDS